jgi:hypothetical protein
MKRMISAFVIAVFISGMVSAAGADDKKDPNAVLDKAIKALGGEQKLSSVKAFMSKAKGKVYIQGNESEFTNQATAQGLTHYRGEFEGEFGGNKIHGVTVLNGDKGWRKFGDMGGALEGDQLAGEKRNVYLQIIPITILPLKAKEFKVEALPEEKVGDKPAVGIKVTGPEGKDFQLFFDKESGLPVKEVAKVMGFGGEETTQETIYQDYKDFGGIKRPSKVTVKRDGEKFLEQEVTEFKVLDKLDPKTFDEPQ